MNDVFLPLKAWLHLVCEEASDTIGTTNNTEALVVLNNVDRLFDFNVLVGLAPGKPDVVFILEGSLVDTNNRVAVFVSLNKLVHDGFHR